MPAHALVPAAHYNTGDAIYRYRWHRRITPEIGSLIRLHAYSSVVRASQVLQHDAAYLYDEYASRYYLRAYHAIERGKWDPARCAYTTWVRHALQYESRAINRDILHEAARARQQEPVEVLDICPSKHDPYEAIELRDIRSQLRSPLHKKLFDAVVAGDRGWEHLRDIIPPDTTRHHFYCHIWPSFVYTVRSIIQEWKEI